MAARVPPAARRAATSPLVMTRKDHLRGDKAASQAWLLASRGGAGHRELRSFKDDILARRHDSDPPKYTSEDAARLLGAMAKAKVVDRDFNKFMTDHILIARCNLRHVCMLASAFEKMRVNDKQFFDRITKFTFDPHRGARNSHTPKNQPLDRGFAKIEDQGFIAIKLSICGYHSAMQRFFEFCRRKEKTENAAKWVQHFDAIQLGSLLNQCSNLRSMPGHLSRHCFERILSIQAREDVVPINRGERGGASKDAANANADVPSAWNANGSTITDANVVTNERAEVPKFARPNTISPRQYAQYARGFAFIAEAEEFRAVAVPMMVTQGLQNPRNVNDETLVAFLWALAKAKVPLDTVPVAFDELAARADNIRDWPLRDVYRGVFALAACATHNFDEGVQLPERLMSVKDVLCEFATSVESGEVVRTGELAKLFWSFAKLKHDDQFHLQGLASCVREHPQVTGLLNQQQGETILLAMSKLRMLPDHDVFEAVLDRTLSCFDPSDPGAPILISSIFKALGVFAPKLHLSQRAAYARALVTLLTKAEFRLTIGGQVTRVLWGLSRTKHLPSPLAVARLHNLLDYHARDLSEYEVAEAHEWRMFYRDNASRHARDETAAARRGPAATPRGPEGIEARPTDRPLREGFAKPQAYDVPTWE